MPAKVKFRHLAVSLVLLGYPLLSGGQTSKPTLDAYISQSVVEANNPNFPTVEEWIRKHPDDIVQTPADKGSDYGSGISWDLKRPEHLRVADEQEMEVKRVTGFVNGIDRIPVNISGKLDQPARLLHTSPEQLLGDSLNKALRIGDSLKFMKNPNQPAPVISKRIARLCG